MTVRAVGRIAPAIAADHVRAACSLALLIAAGMHVAVGLEHAGSDFGALSLAAALAQAALAAVLFTTRSRVVLQAVILLNLLFVQLYVLNVAVGLPPAIAHTHIGGTHQLWGMTLAWPGVVEWQGVLAKTTELIAVGCAVWCAHVGGARGALATPGRGE